MNFLKFIVWLTSGAVFGWLVSEMVAREQKVANVKIATRELDE